MLQLTRLEIHKIKNTFLFILLPIILLAPYVLLLLSYAANQNTSFTAIVAKNIVFVQMISFAFVVITGCYIVAREYKDNTIPYLYISPKPIILVLLSKYVLLIAEIIFSQMFTFGGLIILSGVLDGFDSAITLQYLTTGLLSSLLLAGLTSVIIYIALLKRNFASSALIFLVIFMLTFPFAFQNYGYMFPHQLPLILVSKFLGSGNYVKISYGMGILILAVFFAIFFYLSIHKLGKRG